jgi:propanediol utilization protein
MISLTRGALAEFYQQAGNHNVSFEVEVPDSHVFVGIRHPMYGQSGAVQGTPFIALINPMAPDPASKVLTKIADLHSGEEAAAFLKVVSVVVTSREARSAQEWAEYLQAQIGSNVKVSNYAG